MDKINKLVESSFLGRLFKNLNFALSILYCHFHLFFLIFQFFPHLIGASFVVVFFFVYICCLLITINISMFNKFRYSNKEGAWQLRQSS